MVSKCKVTVRRERRGRATGSPAYAGDDEGKGNVILTFFDILDDANSNVIFISLLTY